jgi:hypothetical protein
MTATVFLILLAGHLLGDWLTQTDWQATAKTRSWPALAAHVTSYHLLMGTLLLLPVLRDGWPAGNALLALTASAVTHAVIDRRWPVRALLRVTASPNFATLEWGVISADQAPPRNHSRHAGGVARLNHAVKPDGPRDHNETLPITWLRSIHDDGVMPSRPASYHGGNQVG